jgi:hypothetical protein
MRQGDTRLKKMIFLGLVLLFFIGVFAVAEDSNIFVKTMPITKVYTHRLGFKVIYLKTDLTFSEFYVPLKWFDEAGNKGVIIRGHDSSYPYFSIFWKEGEFHSVKLYVHSNLQHDSWGALRLVPDISEQFEIDALDLEF